MTNLATKLNRIANLGGGFGTIDQGLSKVGSLRKGHTLPPTWIPVCAGMTVCGLWDNGKALTIDKWWEGWREGSNQHHSYVGVAGGKACRHRRYPTPIVARGGKCRVARNNDVGQLRHRRTAMANVRVVLFCGLVSRRAYPTIDHTAGLDSSSSGEWRNGSS